jgi:hypothetical protein
MRLNVLFRSERECLNHRQCGHVFTDLSEAKWLVDDREHAYPTHALCADGPWPMYEVARPSADTLQRLNEAMREGTLLLLTAPSAH